MNDARERFVHFVNMFAQNNSTTFKAFHLPALITSHDHPGHRDKDGDILQPVAWRAMDAAMEFVDFVENDGPMPYWLTEADMDSITGKRGFCGTKILSWR